MLNLSKVNKYKIIRNEDNFKFNEEKANKEDEKYYGYSLENIRNDGEIKNQNSTLVTETKLKHQILFSYHAIIEIMIIFLI